jgi:hypothetical protein
VRLGAGCNGQETEDSQEDQRAGELAALQIRHGDFSNNTNRMEISTSTTSDVVTLMGASNGKIPVIAAGRNSRYSSSQ